MTSISSATTPVLDSRTIGRLFGAKADEAPDDAGASGSTSAVTDPILAIASGSRVAGTTSGAIAAVQLAASGGTQTAASKAAAEKAKDSQVSTGAVSAQDATAADATTPHKWTVADSNALVQANNAMTSQQISDALYGKGFLKFGGDGFDTFQRFLDDNRAVGVWEANYAQTNTDLSDEHRAAMAEDAKASLANLDSLQTAYNNHTLVIQKGSDVEGLDDTRSEVFHDFGSWGYTQITGTYNNDFFKTHTGKNQSVCFLGGVGLYLSW